MSEESEAGLKEWEQASFGKTLSYSFGFLLVYFMGTQFNAYVFYYYEVEIGLPVLMLAMAFIIFAVWNMINDPLLGYLTDRPFRWTKKWGMRFPWMMIGAIPYFVLWYLIFAVPDDLVNNSDPWPLFWYFVILTCLFDTFYSLYATHINAGYMTHFKTDAERRRSSAINTTIPQILAVTLGLAVPIFYVYGDRSTMIFAQGILVIAMIVCLIIAIPGLRESDELKARFLRGYEDTKRESYWKTMKLAFHHNNFMATLLAFVLLSLAGLLSTASGIYFFKDILRLDYSWAVISILAGFIGFILFIPFWSNMSKKHGHGKIMKLSYLLIAIGYVPGLWMTTLFEAVIFSFIGGVFVGAFWVTLGPVMGDVYDECTIETGKHQEASYEGIRTFFLRIVFIFQAVLFAFVHIVTGYNPNPNATQTPLAIWGIRVLMSLIPAILAVLAFLVFKKWYDLAGEKQAAQKGKLREMGL